MVVAVLIGILAAAWLSLGPVDRGSNRASSDPMRSVVPEGPADPLRDGEADGWVARQGHVRSGPVECEVSEPVEYYDVVTVQEVDPDSLEIIAEHRPVTDGTWIRFRPVSETGLGWIRSRRHERGTLAWVDGACIDLVELTAIKTRAVSGVVDGQIEVGGVAVHGRCTDEGRGGFSGALAADGTFSLTLPHDQACELVVLRVWTDRTLSSEPVPVAPGTADLQGIVLETPAPPGVGMGLYPADGGMLVHDLQLGSVADEAGIRKRDLVVAIDGDPVDGDDAALLQALEGPLSLEVERGGQVFEVVIPAPM